MAENLYHEDEDDLGAHSTPQQLQALIAEGRIEA
jgi:hypothetical protein